MKNGYYQADTINGVTYAGELLEDEACEVVSARDFADSLKTLFEDEVIVAFFDESTADILAEVSEEYGIH